MFPRIYAWFSIILGRPFAVPLRDVSIHENSMNVRIRGYFDTTLQIRFDESDFDAAVRYLTAVLSQLVRPGKIQIRGTRRTKPCTGVAVASVFLKSKSTPAARDAGRSTV